VGLLTLKCKKCGSEIKKISKFIDIFSIKRGKIIECKQCHTKYAVPKAIQRIGTIYHYLFIGGGIAIIWLFLTVLMDKIFRDELSSLIGVWMWLISALIYILIEIMIALLLPLKKIKTTKAMLNDGLKKAQEQSIKETESKLIKALKKKKRII